MHRRIAIAAAVIRVSRGTVVVAAMAMISTATGTTGTTGGAGCGREAE